MIMDRMNKEVQLDKMEKEWGRLRMSNIRNRMIRKGDRIFARLTMGARTVIEFMVDKVESMTDLLLEVHKAAAGIRGLCKLYVRNQSRGWAQERPLMLYGSQGGVGASSLDSRTSVGVTTSPFSYYSHMQFPWETH